MPTLPKMFRPVTRNTLIFLFGLILSAKIGIIIDGIYTLYGVRYKSSVSLIEIVQMYLM